MTKSTNLGFAPSKRLKSGWASAHSAQSNNFSVFVKRVVKDCSFCYSDRLDSDQTGWMTDQTGWMTDQTGWMTDQTGWMTDQTGWMTDQTGWMTDQTGWMTGRIAQADQSSPVARPKSFIFSGCHFGDHTKGDYKNKTR